MTHRTLRYHHAQRIWLIGDLHLGVKGGNAWWLAQQLRALREWIFVELERSARSGDLIAFLGDIFDNRQSLSLLVLEEAVRFFEELGAWAEARGYRVVLLSGNHDLFHRQRRDVTALACLRHLPATQVLTEETVLELANGVQVVAQPWTGDRAFERATRDRHPQASYLLCHTDFRGLRQNAHQVVHEGNELATVAKFRHVYAGHVHHRHAVGNVTVVGTPYQLTRTDRDNQKGIYLLDLATGEHQFLPNTLSPTFHKVHVLQLLQEPLGEVQARYRGQLVDLVVPADKVGELRLRELQQDLLAEAAELHVVVEQVGQQAAALSEELQPAHLGQADLLGAARSYLDRLQVDQPLRERLATDLEKLLAT